ncbi:MAG: DinB family protein [Bacteroidota bacterium]
MSLHTQSLANLLIQETQRRLFEESVPRIKKCLAMISEEEVWLNLNEATNSIGNLILHLNGNVRQWILSGLVGQPDTRKRQEEFDAQPGSLAKTDLIHMLDQLEAEVQEALQNVSPDDLLRKRSVQVFEESGLSILVHVVEHFSYHVGQITYIVKSIKNEETHYYGGQNL